MKDEYVGPMDLIEGSATEAKMSAESRTLARESPIRPMYFEARITRISYTLGTLKKMGFRNIHQNIFVQFLF